MTQEEKAKAYDKALEKARQLCAYPTSKPFISDLQDLFPELKESKDEKVRKEILEYFQQFDNKELRGVDISDWIAWLEKQGEQKSILSMPEFKEGDILYNKDSYASDSIFIFKSMADKTNAYLCYARLYDGKNFSVYSKEDWDKGVGVYGGEFYPANHKQKKLLFSEIEKAGYKWNPDEKKMEKIEQKPLSSQEVMDIAIAKDFEQDELKPVSEIKTSEESLGIDSDTYNKIVDECIYNEQKTSWSEEDKKMLEYAINMIEWYSVVDKSKSKRVSDWLKFLKDRVQPQQQQEWSEEDEKFFNTSLWHICNSISNGKSTDILCDTTYWFISLKERVQPQNRWKPSDEQIRELGIVATGKGWFNKEILSNLLEQLKKLRKE